MTEEARRLSLTDIANHAEVQLSAVSNWRKRHAGFPSPRVVSGQEVFEVRAVAQWLQERRIPQNRLKADELPGTSYGDRFLKNIGAENSSEELGASHETLPRKATWNAQLWRAMDRLRGTYSVAASLELVLGFAYVRTQRVDLWTDLIDASCWPDVWHTLPRVAMPSGVGAPSLPVFRNLASDPDPALFETIRIIDEIDFGSNTAPGSIGAQIGEALLADLERGMGRDGGQFTPPDVAQCLVELLDPQLSDRVYDPFCGSGELLSAAAAYASRQKGPLGDWQVCGQTSHEWALRTSTMNLALHGVKAELRRGDALKDDRFPERRFSRILANPPFNLYMEIPRDRPWLFGVPPAHNANFAWLQHVISKLTPDGRAAVVMAGGAASTLSKSEAPIRAAMVQAGVVECVIAFPPNLFRFTGIPTMVWILRSIDSTPIRRETLFVDAGLLGDTSDRNQRRLSADEIGRIVNEYRRWRTIGPSEEFAKVDGFSRAVSHVEIGKNDFVLVPRRYTAAEPEEFDSVSALAHLLASQDELERLRTKSVDATAALDTQLADLIAHRRPDADGPAVPLGSVCDILSGPGSVPRSDPQSSWTPLVLPRNIRNGLIESGDMDAVPPMTADRMARYRLRSGDIVSARAGTLGRYGLVRKEQAGWLLGPGCVRFRPGDQADPEYMTYYLGSPAAQRWLIEHTSGSVIRHINAKTLREMPVWLPELTVQHTIVDTLRTFDAAASMHSKMAATTEDIRDLAVAMLMSPVATVEPPTT